MTRLQARRKALVAESEVYRQALKFEVQNLRTGFAQVRRSISLLGTVGSVVRFAAPLAGLALRRRAVAKATVVPPKKAAGFVGNVIRGWQFYRRVSPMVGTVMGLWGSGKRRARSAAPLK